MTEIVLKTAKEIAVLREGGRILAKILKLLAGKVAPGLDTWELEELAREEINRAGAAPAFLGYRNRADDQPFPTALCLSINEEVVHCIPRKGRFLRAGEIVSLDLGINHRGLYTDAAVTVPVGKADDKVLKLLRVTRSSLAAGIAQARAGNTVGDIAAAVEEKARKAGLGVIRDLVGHGVGHRVHEAPQVPNYGRPGTLEKLRVGMVLAIEPMLTLGGHKVEFLDDGWSVVTADGSLSAHFEHTVAITAQGPLILTEV